MSIPGEKTSASDNSIVSLTGETKFTLLLVDLLLFESDGSCLRLELLRFFWDGVVFSASFSKNCDMSDYIFEIIVLSFVRMK